MINMICTSILLSFQIIFDFKWSYLYGSRNYNQSKVKINKTENKFKINKLGPKFPKQEKS